MYNRKMLNFFMARKRLAIYGFWGASTEAIHDNFNELVLGQFHILLHKAEMFTFP